MIDRRDLLLGGLCAGAFGAATYLKPRRWVSVLGSTKIESIVPKSFPGWSVDASEGFVKPKTEGLAASLYDEVVQRGYVSDSLRAGVMLLIAHGGSQSDLLQLHRPEVCYPAVGFTIKSRKTAILDLPGGGKLPVVHIVAASGPRQENVVYWTRLGESFPTNGSEQRSVLLKAAMQGYVPDGVLVRASIVDEDSERAFSELHAFLPALVEAIKPNQRAGLVGTDAAKSMVRA